MNRGEDVNRSADSAQGNSGRSPDWRTHSVSYRPFDIDRSEGRGRDSRARCARQDNREIADTLLVSEKTVASPFSHILTKLRRPSRPAATAYAYDHGLIKPDKRRLSIIWPGCW